MRHTEPPGQGDDRDPLDGLPAADRMMVADSRPSTLSAGPRSLQFWTECWPRVRQLTGRARGLPAGIASTIWLLLARLRPAPAGRRLSAPRRTRHQPGSYGIGGTNRSAWHGT